MGLEYSVALESSRAPEVAGTRNRSETWITLSIIILLTVLSILLVFWNTSRELSWDEADYVANVHSSWMFLWSTSWYIRHAHGPFAIYLAKLGEATLHSVSSSAELPLRLPLVLFGSLSIGITYWGLRHTFKASRFGALAGATLLLFSVIRLQETPVIGPHYPMLTLLVLVITLGYRWLNVATIATASVLGLIFGVALVTMTYAIPLAVAWVLSITVSDGSWIKLDRTQLKIAWPFFLVFIIAIAVAAVLWPPSLFQQATISISYTWPIMAIIQRWLVGECSRKRQRLHCSIGLLI
jgi:hypothetical protein